MKSLGSGVTNYSTKGGCFDGLSFRRLTKNTKWLTTQRVWRWFCSAANLHVWQGLYSANEYPKVTSADSN